ncbi:MAG: hypothetical protein WCE46_10905 [Methanoregula sp.]
MTTDDMTGSPGGFLYAKGRDALCTGGVPAAGVRNMGKNDR